MSQHPTRPSASTNSSKSSVYLSKEGQTSRWDNLDRSSSTNNKRSSDVGGGGGRQSNSNRTSYSSHRYSHRGSGRGGRTPYDNTNPSSRWDRLGPSSSSDSRNNDSQNNHRTKVSSQTEGTGTGASRWSNVDRSNLSHSTNANNDKYQPGSHWGQGHTTNEAARTSRWQHPPRSLASLASSSSPSSATHGNSKTKILFIGDSFIKIFTLMENKKIHVKSFKGGSAKGLGRPHNENRNVIVQLVERLRPERIVFCFGSVDVHLSYYYTKVNSTDNYDNGSSTFDLQTIAEKYVEFIQTDVVPKLDLSSSAQTPSDTSPSPSYEDRITVMGIYPSPLEDDDVIESVVAYGSVQAEQVPILLQDPNDLLHAARQARVQQFNQCLEQACAKYQFSFDSAYDDMMENAKMKSSYRDVSDKNIHVVWETTVLLWLQKWSWFRELAPPGFQDGLQRTLDEYLKTKPWAERTHIASTIGVQEAFSATG